MVNEKTKYVKELKKHLNSMMKHPASVVQVHLSGEVIIIDVRAKFNNLLHNQKAIITYHDCFPLPATIGYGVAVEQAKFIQGCYNEVVKSFYMVD